MNNDFPNFRSQGTSTINHNREYTEPSNILQYRGKFRIDTTLFNFL